MSTSARTELEEARRSLNFKNGPPPCAPPPLRPCAVLLIERPTAQIATALQKRARLHLGTKHQPTPNGRRSFALSRARPDKTTYFIDAEELNGQLVAQDTFLRPTDHDGRLSVNRIHGAGAAPFSASPHRPQRLPQLRRNSNSDRDGAGGLARSQSKRPDRLSELATPSATLR